MWNMWKPKIIEINGVKKNKENKYVVLIEINVVKQKTMCYSHRRSARLFSSLLSQRFMLQHRKQEIFPIKAAISKNIANLNICSPRDLCFNTENKKDGKYFLIFVGDKKISFISGLFPQKVKVKSPKKGKV